MKHRSTKRAAALGTSPALSRPQPRRRLFVTLQDNPVLSPLLVRERHELDQPPLVVGPDGVRSVAAQPDRRAVEFQLLARVVDRVLAGSFDGECRLLGRLLGMNPESGKRLLAPGLPVVAPAQ